MNKERMVRMLKTAKEAVDEAELNLSGNDLGNFIGQLLIASAIEEAGSSISMSLDNLGELTHSMSEIASAIRRHSN